MNINEPPSLLRNDYINGPNLAANNWIEVKLIGVKSNRSAIGGRVRLKTGGHLQAQDLSSQSSYYSRNDPRLHFGLGASKTVDQIEIRWPSGSKELIKDISANQIVTNKEASGIVRLPASGK